MRILIVSDTHRENSIYLNLVQQWAPLDMVIHCGDVEGSEYTISEAVECPTIIVQGNNDFFTDLPKERQVKIGRHQVLVTHGHYYHVATAGHRVLVKEAKERKIDIVMYGHTHRPVIEKEDGVLVINPGSLTYPRQSNRRSSYIIMETNQEDEPVFQIHYI